MMYALRFMFCSRLDEDVCSAQSIDEDVRSALRIHEDNVCSSIDKDALLTMQMYAQWSE